MKNRGMTLVEALVGIALLQVGIFSALYINDLISKGNRGTNDRLNYSLFRNQIFLYLRNTTVWKYTLRGAKNTDMACWLNQDQVPAASRNCYGKSGNLVVYNIKGDIEYDFSETDAGLTTSLNKCVGFVPLPGVANSQCPMGFQLTWTAVCENGDSDCTNPLLRIDGKFKFNGGPEQAGPGSNRLDFTTYEYMKYCPVQTLGWGLVDGGIPPAVTVTGTSQVQSGNTGKTVATGFAKMTKLLIPCRDIALSYTEDMGTAPPSPMLVSDVENKSQVCLFDQEANSCRFEVIREYVGGMNRIRLRAQGADVGILPVFLSLSNTSIFNIRVHRNLVEFLVDGRVYFSWPQKLTFPFEARFKPASRDYSSGGLFNIQAIVTN